MSVPDFPVPKPKDPDHSDASKSKGAAKRALRKARASTRSTAKPAKRAPVVLKMHWKWRMLAVMVVVGLLVSVVYASWASLFDLSQLGVMPQRTWIYDCKDKPFSRLVGEDRVVVPVAQISPNFINALLAREDSRFYQHHGVDPVGIARAIVRNILHFQALQGASTLTQQLARKSFPLGGKNMHRKLLEAFLALRIERNFSKTKILESYANRIYFGSGFYGVETASRAYFGKPSAKLTLSEGAALAGLIRSPNRFSPFNNLEASVRERNTVLDRMVSTEKITAAQAEEAKATELVVSQIRPPSAEQNYATELVEQELNQIVDDDQLADGGLRIYTTIDPELQRVAQSSLDGELTKVEQRPGYSHPKRSEFGPTDGSRPTPYLQGAVIVLDNATGGIRAVVGGRNYSESRLNRAYSARPVGSTFKPFVYAAAYASGSVQPSTGISDGPIRRGELRSAPRWAPGNSDGTFRGVLPAEEGLILSRNTMSARVGDRAGLELVRKLAASAGLGQLPDFASIYLGSFEAKLRDLAAAYTVFPNGGVRKQSFLVEKVLDSSGRTLYRSARIESRVLDPSVCWMVSTALEKVFQRGTAAGADFHKPAAGKTGTTNDYRDAWFVGYTRSLTCGVWVGLDTPAPIMARGYGATLALPVWCDVMNSAVSGGYSTRSFQPPSSYSGAPLRASDKPLPDRIVNSFRHLFER